jgi:hypothetical protein
MPIFRHSDATLASRNFSQALHSASSGADKLSGGSLCESDALNSLLFIPTFRFVSATRCPFTCGSQTVQLETG